MAAPPFGDRSDLSPASAHGAAPGASTAFPFDGGSGSLPAPSHEVGSVIPPVPLYRATMGSSANPLCPWGPEHSAPEEGPSRREGHGYTPRSRGY